MKAFLIAVLFVSRTQDNLYCFGRMYIRKSKCDVQHCLYAERQLGRKLGQQPNKSLAHGNNYCFMVP